MGYKSTCLTVYLSDYGRGLSTYLAVKLSGYELELFSDCLYLWEDEKWFECNCVSLAWLAHFVLDTCTWMSAQQTASVSNYLVPFHLSAYTAVYADPWLLLMLVFTVIMYFHATYFRNPNWGFCSISVHTVHTFCINDAVMQGDW
jgi:hypothetical protein